MDGGRMVGSSGELAAYTIGLLVHGKFYVKFYDIGK